MIDWQWSLGLVVAALALAAAYAGRVSCRGAAHHPRVERAGGSVLLGKGPMQMGYWAMGPVAAACVALGIGASAVSWASLALGAAAGLWIAAGHLGVGAAFGAASSLCDALDGMIARRTATASDSGEVLDATVDRYTELFFLGGVAFHERQDALALCLSLAAIAGSVMVSYATAKAEALRVSAPRGLMRRQERAVYLVLGAALSPLAAAAAARCFGAPPPLVAHLPLLVALALVAAVGNASAAWRLYVIARAVARPGPALAHASSGPEKRARDTTHAAAGDVVR